MASTSPSPEDPQIITYYPRNSKTYYPKPQNISNAPVQYVFLVYNDSRVGSNFITAYWDFQRDWQPDTSKWNTDGTPKKKGDIYTKKFTINGVKNFAKKAWEQIEIVEVKWYWQTKNDTVWHDTGWTGNWIDAFREDTNPHTVDIPNFDPSKTTIPYKYSYAQQEIFDMATLKLQPGDSVQKIKFGIRVTPATYLDSKGETKYFWSGKSDKTTKAQEWTTAEITVDASVNSYYPEVPRVTVSVDGLQLTATVTLDNDDVNTKKITFYLYDKATEAQLDTMTVTKGGIGSGNTISVNFTISYNTTYVVRAKAINDDFGHPEYGILESELSEAAETTSGDVPPPVVPDPSDPEYEVSVPSISSNSYSYKEGESTYVSLQWTGPSGFQTIIQYANSQTDLDATGGSVSSVTVDVDITSKVIGPLETGKTYYFRVAAHNDKGTGSWSKVWSIGLGEKPDIPNIGVNNNVFDYDIGESFTVWWIHQSADGTKEKEAILTLVLGADDELASKFAEEYGGTAIASTVTIHVKKQSYDKTSLSEKTFRINPTYFTKDISIFIVVRTISTMNEVSDLSNMITIKCWTQATPYINIYRRKRWFWKPFNFKKDNIYNALGDFKKEDMVEDSTITQFPFFVLAGVNPIGRRIVDYSITITAATEYDTVDIFGEDLHINIGDEIWSSLTSNRDNIRYHQETNELDLYFLPTDLHLEDDQSYEINFIASLNNGKNAKAVSYQFSVNLDKVSYVLDADLTYNPDDISVNILPYCYDYHGDPIPNVLLSVYRESYYGEFVKIADNLNNVFNITVKDPHPTLRQVKYRIVGVDISTGSVFYEDLSPFEVPETAIILQWDSRWRTFDKQMDGMITFSGSLLKLPYNISTSEQPEPDVEMVEYIGREHPVSYYGTQIKETSTWTTDVIRDDIETLYGLRRLAKYRGNVYVREPNGMGYLANVKVSFGIENLAVIIPVTLNITRVEE